MLLETTDKGHLIKTTSKGLQKSTYKICNYKSERTKDYIRKSVYLKRMKDIREIKNINLKVIVSQDS